MERNRNERCGIQNWRVRAGVAPFLPSCRSDGSVDQSLDCSVSAVFLQSNAETLQLARYVNGRVMKNIKIRTHTGYAKKYEKNRTEPDCLVEAGFMLCSRQCQRSEYPSYCSWGKTQKNRTKLCLFGMLRIEPSAVKPPCFFNQIEEENDTH